MIRRVAATDAKAHLLELLDDVAAGEEIEISRHGKLIARLVPARGAARFRNRFKGVAMTIGDGSRLFETGEEWQTSRRCFDDPPA